ncbi:aminotransferase class I/II-fold pyridoxal phosphate-dependent enzyme [Flavobacteriaceae bacterium]|nr:aminotransferase class I/II-fold pyridoxal phosphate-dependent enzyme [Flavobacteriaceae bacterium]MDC1491964.1 aminotransferase class I/II-fold pyridoxal phosphate-dependent enzyme [Flavobacteriaceae bacterium]
MKKKPANVIQDLQYFGEFGGVNPSISDSSTFTFLSAKTMSDTFEGNTDGCHLYSRHTTPSNLFLGEAISAMENTESAIVFGSGMGAITSTLLQLCKSGDHVVSSRTVYGGTYAFLKNFASQLNISTSFVNITDLEAIKKSINSNTKLIYCEAVSNPLLEIADILEISKIAKEAGILLVIDNTFSPLSILPANLGADIVIHSITKFINGMSDTIAGVVCASQDFINQLRDVNDGASMLFGSTLDSLRAASVLKNLRTLPLRIKKHSENAMYFANMFEKDGIRTVYPGLKSHLSHDLYNSFIDHEYGYGGILTIDAGKLETANKLMELMQKRNVGYLAVSLGFYKTLFSTPGSSTSSEIPEEEQIEMGLNEGLIRFSIGLDNDIERTYKIIKECMKEVNLI